MRDLGPWPSGRGVAVAVSGGADSLALALLVRGWSAGRTPPLALVVDHRLRPGSAGEAAATRSTLAALGIPTRLLELDLGAGARLQERARRARHAALAEACARAGLLDLLLGHHRADQDETIRMRARAGSGPGGLAGMAAVSEHNGLRLVRPLLDTSPARLRATLRTGGVGWIEDPSNADLRFERARLRAAPEPPPGRVEPPDRGEDAAWLAAHVTIHECGFALLPAAPIPASALSRLVQTLSGREYPPRRADIERLAADPRPATLHGVRLSRAGRYGPGLLACREAAAVAAPVPAVTGALWDGRFRLTAPAPDGWTIGALGRLRRDAPLPSAVVPVLPALFDRAGALRAAPHLDDAHEIGFIFAPRLPIAPSFFIRSRQASTPD